MKAEEQLFVDGTMDVAIQNGVVRIDFFTFAPVRAEGETAEREFQQRLIMPLPAFAQTFGAMERMMKELMDRGVVSRKDAEEAAKGATNA